MSLVVMVGPISQAATATEELVVNGAEAASRAQESKALFRSDMKEFVEALNRSIKTSMDKDLKQMAAPKLMLALNEAGSRG